MEKSTNSFSHDQNNSWIPPVVTVMGHVDHGKTTLLDTIRHTRVAAKESGGITQHIGAYSIEVKGKKITFIDTPGHEAYLGMRQRGGKVSDLVVLVVDASEGVRPQTLEAISHVKSFNLPVIVALNKIDLPTANPAAVKSQLASNGIFVEGFGGDTVSVEVSGKTGENLDALLEMIILVNEMNPPKGREDSPLEAYIIESRLDRRRGPTATVVVKSGVIRLGDEVFAGKATGRIKQIVDDSGKPVSRVLPGMAAEILGFSSVPMVGEKMGIGKGVISSENGSQPEAERPILETEGPTLNLILKTDVMGSLEALKLSLRKVPLFADKAVLVLSALGDVNDSDVNLAKASGASIIAFRVKVLNSASDLAQSFGVEIQSYDIIYKVLEDLEAALKGMKAWQKGTGKARAEVIKIFPLKSGDRVLGCRILSGNLNVGDEVEIVRGSSTVGRGRIENLKIGKEKVTKVNVDKECGVLLNGNLSVSVGDQLEEV